MKQSVIKVLEEARSKLSAHAALLNYRYANLCIEAAPEALLSVTVNAEGEEMPIEKAARAKNASDRKDQFEIFPTDPSFLIPIVKGIMDVHPEFKIEVKHFEDSDDPEDSYILATMPEVDDARHELLTDAVGVLADGCDTQMKVVFATCTTKLAHLLMDADPEELDEAKDQLQQFKDMADDLCKQYRENKEAEIEAAYQNYLEKKAAKEAEINEKAEAMKEQLAGMQMKFTPEDE
ncbi:MAG: ribosome recycling factor [Bacteroidales bacterium]|nr:ribosome recycling factor [Bacteroidales bacterium]